MSICPLLNVPCNGSWIDERYPDDDVVVRNLLDSSPEFRAFYQNERKKIKSNLYWVQCDKLPRVMMGYTATLLPRRDFVIPLRTIPPPIDSSSVYNVAHELEHAVRIFEEKAFGIPTPRDGNPDASNINTMIEDPRVDSNLLKYGFDLKSEYETQLRAEMPIIRSIAALPDEKTTKILYVKKRLCCDLLGDFEPWSEFEELFKSRFPHLMNGIDELYNFVKENEFQPDESVERVKRLLEIVYGVRLS